MPIEIGVTRSPEERLYDAIGQVANALSLADRLALFAAMKNGKPFRELAPELRRAFAQALELMRRGGGI